MTLKKDDTAPLSAKPLRCIPEMTGFSWAKLGTRLNIGTVNPLKEPQLTQGLTMRPYLDPLARRINRSSQCQELQHWGRYSEWLVNNTLSVCPLFCPQFRSF